MPLGDLLKQPQRLASKKPSRRSEIASEVLGMVNPSMGLAQAVNSSLSGTGGALGLGMAAAGIIPGVPALGGKSKFLAEIENLPDGKRMLNIDATPDQAKLLSEIGHDFGIDVFNDKALNPVQILPGGKGRTRVRLDGDQAGSFLSYFDEFLEQERGAADLYGQTNAIPGGINRAIQKLRELVGDL